MLYETVELRSPRFWPRFILILDSQPSELILPPCWHLWQSGDPRIEESLTDNCNDRGSRGVSVFCRRGCETETEPRSELRAILRSSRHCGFAGNLNHDHVRLIAGRLEARCERHRQSTA